MKSFTLNGYQVHDLFNSEHCVKVKTPEGELSVEVDQLLGDYTTEGVDGDYNVRTLSVILAECDTCGKGLRYKGQIEYYGDEEIIQIDPVFNLL